jgi:predicted AAA+ superfamily ATPase
MVFLAGPRQSGKTTFCQIVLNSFANHIYFNWDIPGDRERFISDPSFFEDVERKDMSRPLVVFDEIHKYKAWKNYLKGVYDRFHDEFQFLVSGSGRLDLYQKGSDSLAGRYFLYHMWPFTIAELAKKNKGMDDFLQNPLDINLKHNKKLSEIWNRLSEFSGFPEPYLAGKKRHYRRWSNTYSRQLIREDIRDLTGVKAINEIETLFMLLPSKTGSPLSSASLARDLQVSYNTINSWLSIFETFFMVFSITPWTKKISRAILKERKYYIWDSPRIANAAQRFENMVALELYRAVTSWNDIGHGTFSVNFIKNKEKQEVDFLLTKENKPFLLVEAKLTETQPSKALIKFQSKLNVPGVQLIKEGNNFKYFSNGPLKILVAPGFQWLSSLP